MMHYELKKVGELVVTLLHGLGEDHSIFNRQVNYLNEKGYSTLAVDLLYHGRSSDNGRVSIQAQVLALEEVLNKENIFATALVGFSLGGTIALDFTLKHPDKVDRLALINPALSSDAYFTKKTKAVKYMLDMLSSVSKKDVVNRSNPADLSQAIFSNAYFSFLNGFRNTCLRGLYENIDALCDYGVPICLSKIQAPTLIIRGKDDELLTRDLSAMLASKIPNSQYVEMPGNHVLVLDKSREVNELLGKWLV